MRARGAAVVFGGILAVGILSLLWGMPYAMRCRRRNPALELEDAHRCLAPLLAPLGTLVVAAGVTLALHLADGANSMLPVWVQRFGAWVPWGAAAVLAGFLGGYVGVVIFASRYAQRRLLGCLLVLTNVMLYRFVWVETWPVAGLVGVPEEQNGVVMQTTNWTCAPASVATLAGRLGRPASEREVARMMGTTKTGTSPAQIRWALWRLGIRTETTVGEGVRIDDVGTPAILLVDHPAVGAEGHAVVFAGMTQDGLYEILDPLRGRVAVSRERLERDWHGHAIVCRPTGDTETDD